MQRVLLVLLTLFALYACTSTQPPSPVEERSTAPLSEVEIPASLAEPIVPEIYEPPPEPIIVDKARAIPHIALLLPLRSPIFGAAASAVERGFMAAARQDGQMLPIQTYDHFDENNSVVPVYRQAVSIGALAVVGPITRNGVMALAASRNTPVPTLSLNVVNSAPPINMYYFGMDIEAEARQIAHLARQNGLHEAIIITSREQLSKRLQSAFEEEWNGLGGAILREVQFEESVSILNDITETPGLMVFVAADAE